MITDSELVNRTHKQAYLSLAMNTKTAVRFMELKRLEGANLPILHLLAFQQLFPTI
jgi:hypothetical protein